MSALSALGSRMVLGMRVDATSYEDACLRVRAWSLAGKGSYICVSNVHMTMESYDDPVFRTIVNQADLITPDGMPLVWAMRLQGVRQQQRVYGPELTLRVCEMAAREGIPVALYGGTPESLTMFAERMEQQFRGLKIVCKVAPPFRPPTLDEDAVHTQMIVDSGARIVLVGIGCPKQERWMAEHKNRISAVMLGVGAAFDFHSGRVRQAPPWIQRSGLEWLFRLMMEPRRLWKRYLKHNPRFAFLMIGQLLGARNRLQNDEPME